MILLQLISILTKPSLTSLEANPSNLANNLMGTEPIFKHLIKLGKNSMSIMLDAYEILQLSSAVVSKIDKAVNKHAVAF